MTCVRVDWKGLDNIFREREHYSLPFEVRPTRRGAHGSEILAAVRSAVDAANAAAQTRFPTDPSWCTDGDATPKAVVAEIAKGSMREDEVTAWLVDLTAALDAADVSCQVVPHRPSARASTDSWYAGLPFVPTAFLYFTSTDNGPVTREIPMTALRRTVPLLVDWALLPAAQVAMTRGMSEFRPKPGNVAEELMIGQPSRAPEISLTTYTAHPRRLRYARFDSNAIMVLQSFDERATPAEALDGLLDAVRIYAADLDYAFVRLGDPTIADFSDIGGPYAQGAPRRQLTEAEELSRGQFARHLFTKFIPDAHVAQILTAKHLDKVDHFDKFDIQPLAGDRFLVKAKDPAAWLDASNKPDPETDTQRAARQEFAHLLLSYEYARSHPPT